MPKPWLRCHRALCRLRFVLKLPFHGFVPRYLHLAPGHRRGRRRSFGPWLWLALLLVLAGGCWFFLKTTKPQPKEDESQAPTRASRSELPPATNTPEKGERLPSAQTSPQPPPTPFTPRPAANVLEAQLVMERRGISSGSLDGVMGTQTRNAIRAFQQQERLPQTGSLDKQTMARLLLTASPFTNYVITSTDLERLHPVPNTWLGKSEQTALYYESILELIAERFHSHPGLIRSINPEINWTNVTPGLSVIVPNVTRATPRTRAAFISIRIQEKILQAFDAQTNLLAHFPCSIARLVEKRPYGKLVVVRLAQNPNYLFNPETFPESQEARTLGRKLILPPGPNSPVGTAWIGLDKPGYGIHGTPIPELVGRTESHGCFRLANWNAEFLLKLAWIGLPVFVEANRQAEVPTAVY